MLDQGNSTIRRKLAFLAVLILFFAPELLAVIKTKKQPNFFAVCGIKIYREKGGMFGGTGSLISDRWIITAWHVVQPKRAFPDTTTMRVIFRKGSLERRADKIIKCPGVDMAICRLTRPVTATNTPKIALLGDKLIPSDGRISFTQVGRGKGLEYHRNRTGNSNGVNFNHHKSANGSRPGVAGDSGGAFLVERYCDYKHIQFAVIHGGGTAVQVGYFKKLINNTLATTGDKCTWVDKNTMKNWHKKDLGTPYPYKATWGKGPVAASDTSITMNVKKSCDDSAVEHYFECIDGGGHDSGWQASSSYTDTGLIPGRTYTYVARVRDKSARRNQTEDSVEGWAKTTGFSFPAKSIWGEVPDPVPFSNISITMTADSNYDGYGFEYYFTCTEGGHDSGWQTSSRYTDTGIYPGTKCTYTVKMRDISTQTLPSDPRSATAAGLRNLDFELPVANSTGIDGWYNSTGTFTRNETEAGYPNTPYGKKWGLLANGSWMYQKIGEWIPNTTYEISFLAGQRYHSTLSTGFTNLYVGLLAGGHGGYVQDDLDISYADNPLELVVGASVVDMSGPISPFTAAGEATKEITIRLSTGPSIARRGPLWVQFHKEATTGNALIDNVVVRDVTDEPLLDEEDVATDLNDFVPISAGWGDSHGISDLEDFLVLWLE